MIKKTRDTNTIVANTIKNMHKAVTEKIKDATSGADLFVKCYNKYKFNQ